ncbi:MAG: class I SAM-dependent methyltransferase [Treponema sp.]|nr:class I SAM-dependent methyltransferase [Treponema sp.]
MTALEKYYNTFNEEHRLETRHGIVEFTTTMKYIHECIQLCTVRNGSDAPPLKILDLGAGTGRYSVALAQEGHSVTAVELVPRNLAVLESKHAAVNCWPGDARNLHFLDNETFDITLMFGPLYHLHTQQDMLQAFAEARRVTKKEGCILAAYVMNEYSILTYCFKQNHIKDVRDQKKITADFHTIADESELYTYFRLEDINELNRLSGLERIKIIAADGAADYMRRELNAMDSDTFSLFLDYHLATCERPELLGASSHLVDILKN